MANPERRRWLRRALPDSLLGRIVVVMALGVISAQLVGTLLWARQLRETARTDALLAGRHIALNASRGAVVLTFLCGRPAAMRRSYQSSIVASSAESPV